MSKYFFKNKYTIIRQAKNPYYGRINSLIFINEKCYKALYYNSINTWRIKKTTYELILTLDFTKYKVIKLNNIYNAFQNHIKYKVTYELILTLDFTKYKIQNYQIKYEQCLSKSHKV